TVSFQVQDKVWDGNTSATIMSSPAPSLVGIVGLDNVVLGTGTATATFATIVVGSNKTVTGSGFTKSGSDSGNYKFATPQGTTTASILAWNAAGKGFYAPVGADIAHSVFTPGGIGTPTTKPGAMTWNTIKGGQTVPLKFNVFAGAVEKTGSDAFPGADPTKAFQMQKLANCTDSLDTDPVDFVASTGQTMLRYDTTGGQWIENWATPKVSATTCYRTYVTFADGSTLEAFFQLSK
ncbi:MAG: PxKF domain-containing protein, partial [Gaiellaceae bacterium]